MADQGNQANGQLGVGQRKKMRPNDIQTFCELLAQVEGGQYPGDEVMQLLQLYRQALPLPQQQQDSPEDRRKLLERAFLPLRHQKYLAKIDNLKYDGRCDALSFETWIYQVGKLRDQTVNLEPPLTGIEQVAVGVHFLKKDALNWWVILQAGMIEGTEPMVASWRQFETALRDRFTPVVDKFEARQKRSLLRQEGRSLEIYDREFSNLVLACGMQMSENDKLFEYGLRVGIQREVRKLQPNSVLDAMQMATRCSDYDRLLDNNQRYQPYNRGRGCRRGHSYQGRGQKNLSYEEDEAAMKDDVLIEVEAEGELVLEEPTTRFFHGFKRVSSAIKLVSSTRNLVCSTCQCGTIKDCRDGKFGHKTASSTFTSSPCKYASPSCNYATSTRTIECGAI